MASSTEIAKRYFAALNDHDLDAAVAVWAPGAPDRLVGRAELVAPLGIREYFGELFAAFPDFSLTVLETTAGQGRAVVRWRGTGTFAGPGRFEGFDPNGARIEIEGCDVVAVADDLIVGNTAYIDGADLARQLGFLPPAGSATEQRLAALANLRTRLRVVRFGVQPEQIAPGVWVVRGGRPRRMNVYLIEDEGGVTVFDAGISEMAESLRAACVRMGGIRRVVLGHADCDHRGSAPGLAAPVYCHEAEREAASSEDSYRPYWDFSQLAPYARPVYRRLLRDWDGGAVEIAGTVAEGDEIAGFRVIELPGHAPGLIGLLRESDRLALVSDCFYTVNPQTGIKNAAHVPHPAFNQDTERARESIRKLAALRPSAAWPGHADPVIGEVTAQLERAAAAPA